MLASELIEQLQDAIRLYGDLRVVYDGYCDIEGPVPYNSDWDLNEKLNGFKGPDRFVLNEHEYVNSYIGPTLPVSPLS